MSEPDSPEELTRRKLLGRVAGACGLALGAAVAVGPVANALSPLVSGDAAPISEQWFTIGGLDAFPVGLARRITLRRDVRDAWLVQRDQPIGIVLVTRLPDTNGAPAFRVLSGVCPHLGCSVSWKGGADAGWLCPCHDSTFGADGSLVPGRENPSPRGLDPLPWRMSQGGALEVQWIRYAIGTAERIAS